MLQRALGAAQRKGHTHLSQELLHMTIQVIVGEVELGDDGVGLVGERHGEGSGGERRCREGSW